MRDWRKYERRLSEIAYFMDEGDPDLHQDLFQAMQVALWEAPECKTDSWYLQKARNSALNFLRWWEKRDGEGELRKTSISALVLNKQAEVNNLLYSTYDDDRD